MDPSESDQTSSTSIQRKSYTTMDHANRVYTEETKLTHKTSKTASFVVKVPGRKNWSNLKCEELFVAMSLDDLDDITPETSASDVSSLKEKYVNFIGYVVQFATSQPVRENTHEILDKLTETLTKIWSIPRWGKEIASAICENLRTAGSMEALIKTMTSDKENGLKHARVLSLLLDKSNRSYVVGANLDKIVSAAKMYTDSNDTEASRTGTSILQNLFRHDEQTCSAIVEMGGLNSILDECKNKDIQTLRECAAALANLSLWGGVHNQENMVAKKVPAWLFHLANSDDGILKYYALLAISALLANNEIQAEVRKWGDLRLMDHFLKAVDPSQFCKNISRLDRDLWFDNSSQLVKLIKTSNVNPEAMNIFAFHLCVQAYLQKQDGDTSDFSEKGLTEILNRMVCCPYPLTSKLASQALQIIGEKVPQKLSQQVPLWTCQDVEMWVRQIGFAEYVEGFQKSKVDGDLLLQLTPEELQHDIGITNGILLKRFVRSLSSLKEIADYSNRDTDSLSFFLKRIHPEFVSYTYQMIIAGITKTNLALVTDEQLGKECSISNSIHRQSILNSVQERRGKIGDMERPIDVFISYRRSTGSQLASLLKVHLQLRGLQVFLDVDRLEAGHFDDNLIKSIRSSKHFVLVLTPESLSRCKDDTECKDWVHREIVAALNAKCNIVPIFESGFKWPKAEDLPKDMRSICHFNAVSWVHEYQEACVNKLESFLVPKTKEENESHELTTKQLQRGKKLAAFLGQSSYGTEVGDHVPDLQVQSNRRSFMRRVIKRRGSSKS